MMRARTCNAWIASTWSVSNATRAGSLVVAAGTRDIDGAPSSPRTVCAIATDAVSVTAAPKAAPSSAYRLDMCNLPFSARGLPRRELAWLSLRVDLAAIAACVYRCVCLTIAPLDGCCDLGIHDLASWMARIRRAIRLSEARASDRPGAIAGTSAGYP